MICSVPLEFVSYYIIVDYLDLSSNIAERATPVPIPNTVVKPFKVDGTSFARRWESRTLLAKLAPLEDESFLAGFFLGRQKVFPAQRRNENRQCRRGGL